MDKICVKIWNHSQRNQVMYDNQMTALDSADPMTALQGGSITIHK